MCLCVNVCASVCLSVCVCAVECVLYAKINKSTYRFFLSTVTAV